MYHESVLAFVMSVTCHTRILRLASRGSLRVTVVLLQQTFVEASSGDVASMARLRKHLRLALRQSALRGHHSSGSHSERPSSQAEIPAAGSWVGLRGGLF